MVETQLTVKVPILCIGYLNVGRHCCIYYERWTEL